MTSPEAAPRTAAQRADDRLREEFPQRFTIEGGSLDRQRAGLPPDFPVYSVHGEYMGRLAEIWQDVDHLSCLGCGKIGTPSTYSATTGIYLCAERCVPAIREAEAAAGTALDQTILARLIDEALEFTNDADAIARAVVQNYARLAGVEK